MIPVHLRLHYRKIFTFGSVLNVSQYLDDITASNRFEPSCTGPSGKCDYHSAMPAPGGFKFKFSSSCGATLSTSSM